MFHNKDLKTTVCLSCPCKIKERVKDLRQRSMICII